MNPVHSMNLGRIYEKQVYQICNKIVNPKGGLFCTMKEKDIGKLLSKDIECNYSGIRDVGIEIKKHLAPDWMQMSIYKEKEDVWISKGSVKIPHESRNILEAILYGNKLYSEEPPFIKKRITHEEWIKYRPNFQDIYLSCPSKTISEIYRAKKCQYIQVSDYGLYHTGEDVCDFGVPYFECDQRLRIRVKIHKTRVSYGKNKGNMIASVIASPQPCNIKQLDKSPYTLDYIKGIPKNLQEL